MHRTANRLMLVAMVTALATSAQAQSPTNNAGATSTPVQGQTTAQGQPSGTMTSGDTAMMSTRTTSTSTGDVDDDRGGSGKAGWLGLLGLLGLLGMRRRGPDTVTRTTYTTGTGPGTTGGTTGRV